MSNVKSIAQSHGMQYEKAGTKKVTDIKSVMIRDASRLSTSRLLWILVKRHKVALLAIGNIILVLNWVFPEWTTFVSGLVH